MSIPGRQENRFTDNYYNNSNDEDDDNIFIQEAPITNVVFRKALK